MSNKIYPIYIASKNRPEGKLLELIKNLDTKKYIIIEPQDENKYKQWGKFYNIIILNKNDQGLYYARDFTKNYAEKQKEPWYWVIDDDISNFYKSYNNKNHKITPEEALYEAQNFFNLMPISLGSLEYQQYSWSQKKEFRLNGYADCCVCFNKERTLNVKYDLNFALKGDRDIALQILNKKKYIMRCLKLSFSCPTFGANKGGLHEVYNKLNLEKEMSVKLAKKWGKKLVTLQIKNTNGEERYDAKINWNRYKVNIT